MMFLFLTATIIKGAALALFLWNGYMLNKTDQPKYGFMMLLMYLALTN